MDRPSVWITKRRGKKGISYLVRWMEPNTGSNRGKTFGRREDAEDFKTQLRREIVNQEYHTPVRMTYGEWVAQHLADLEDSSDLDLAPKTIAGHREALQALGETCRPKGPGAITPAMIREFRQAQLQKGLTARTINKHIAAIRSALSYAARAEIIPSNKLLGPHRLMLAESRKPPHILQVEEAKVLFEKATDMRLKAVISLAYYHGLRRKEICWLRWEDVDLDAKRLHVVHRREARTKTKVSRSVFLRQETADVLRQLRGQHDGEYVFDKPATFYLMVGKWFDALVRESGVDRCTLHDLRKTCNTLMKENGVSVEAAMQVLGHATMQVNLRHYTGTLTKQQEAAVNSLPSIG
jgi:integrase